MKTKIRPSLDDINTNLRILVHRLTELRQQVLEAIEELEQGPAELS